MMKTAVSISDDLFASAEEFARRRGLSRSELYAKALEAYLAERRGTDVTEKLNEVYREGDSSGLDPVLSEMQARTLTDEGW